MAAPDYGDMVAEMREVFMTGRTRHKQWRETQLKSIIRMLSEQGQRFCDALHSDLKKDEYDSIVDEIGFCVNEAKWFLSHLSEMMKDKKKSLDLLNIGGKGYVHYEPLGVVLDISAWNYPLQIPISTLINIISAGNCAVLKPSEISIHTSNLLAELIPQYLDNECIKVVEGAVPETTALLKERWDHVIYTGSGNIGKIVYKAAAEHLTPCTLEMGGKCPGYVNKDSDLESVANRICSTKFANAGQTCIAIDYVLVDASVEQAFLEKLTAAVREQFTDDPATCDSYGRIINERHCERIQGLLEASPKREERLGGLAQCNKEQNYIPPTIVTGIAPDERLMQEEIFGPILPVLPVRDHLEAIDFINEREKALHLNVFSKSQAIVEEFVSKTSSGGLSANDCSIFKMERGLPFGGVGASGFGAYGGYAGFENFSHKKPVLWKPQGMEFLFKWMRYAPHTPAKLKRIKMIQELPKKISKVFRGLSYVIPAGILLGVALYFGLNRGAAISKPEL